MDNGHPSGWQSIRVRRPAVVVREALRSEIVSGRLRPGQRLPTHVELAARFGVSNVTVQHALNRLAAEGVVEIRPRAGSFVSGRPPHLHCHALVFCFDPSGPFAGQHWSLYHQTLAQVALRWQQEGEGRQLLMFHGVDHHADSEDRQRLVAFLEAQRLAGVVFTNSPFALKNTPILDLPGIPRVSLASKPCHANEQVVAFDSRRWLELALDHLRELGRRRVALIELGTSAHSHPFEATFQQELAARGMLSLPRWRQFVSLNKLEGGRQVAELLMHDREPPDALLIADDNLVSPVVAGLLAAGMRGADDLAVVAHANFPCSTPHLPLPVHQLGYRLDEALEVSLGLIDRQRQGEETPATTWLAPQWGEAVEAADAGLRTAAAPVHAYALAIDP